MYIQLTTVDEKKDQCTKMEVHNVPRASPEPPSLPSGPSAPPT